MQNNIFQKSDLGILNAQLRNNFYKKYPYLWQGLQCKKLYHYTDLTAFKSILENKSLWMSNPKYLNDSEEFIEGKNKVIKFIECYISRNKKISPNFIEILEEVKIKIAEDNCFDKEFFISSFSTIKDDLSQWRAYGKDREGICLELDNFGCSQFHALAKVIYKSSEKYRLIYYIHQSSIKIMKQIIITIMLTL
ncbi:hypothetical protein [Francisella sp. 19X1-34]|uniref:hypothetical protein n=1 Tax=Francisella sp. 19X1-34 TaxID=3087177 RepID=UPI002E353A3E|nr:hypothetical protein [Francisella sp. 19X1-34]MED7789453.1 hypothetical protein [Francisella sp. 19X1-34]